MTAKSSDSLMSDVPNKSEERARIEAALRVARASEAHIGRVGWNAHTAGLGLGAPQKIITILESGK